MEAKSDFQKASTYSKRSLTRCGVFMLYPSKRVSITARLQNHREGKRNDFFVFSLRPGDCRVRVQGDWLWLYDRLREIPFFQSRSVHEVQTDTNFFGSVKIQKYP